MNTVCEGMELHTLSGR